MNAIQTVTINNAKIAVKEYNGVRVVTFKDIDACHERPDGTAKRNFNQHKEFFTEGEEFFTIPYSEFSTKFVPNSVKGGNPNNTVVLLTERGYYTLIKSFNDRLSWVVQKMLIDNYFRTQTIDSEEEYNRKIKLAELNIKSMRAKAMLINALTHHMKETGARYKDSGLSTESIKVMEIKALEEITGESFGSILPQVEKTYSATDLGTEFGVTSCKIGKVANDNGLKTAEYGMFVMDKAKSCSKDVQTFRYNEKGRAKLAELLGKKITNQ